VSVERSRPQRSRRRLTNADYQALGAFRHALRRFLAFSEAGAVALGLTPQQHQALLVVRAHAGPNPISVGELAESLLIKNHSALGLVDRLIARGLLTRAPAEEDRRRVALTLTVAGGRLLETISRNNLGQLKSTLPVFSELIEALERLDAPSAADEPSPAEAPHRD
jgi:DNA-binding MarR family transcriptional regulator